MPKRGGGGSQLSQLKSRLRNEGISDRRQMKSSAKKRKRGQAGSEKEEMAERREELNKIASSAAFNPFEERVTKPKNAVLGRKIKGAVGRPGIAKLGGLQERQERLLPEYLSRNKSGSFIDRRFGEDGSSGLSLEEKMLERFTKERQSRVGKTSLYNLDDGEEEGLTHYGKSLNDLDDYDDVHLSDEEEGLQEGAHFGGFNEDAEDKEDGDDEDRRKSKAEVMREVMAKSKLAKYERQQTRMADDDIREELDNELGDLRSLLFEQPKEISKEEEKPVGKRPLFGDGSKKDEYDAAVREMAFERRAKPQDRLKTEAEKAEELAEKLRKAEENRLKRMRGEEPDVEAKGKSRGSATAGGDDLEDDFELDGMTSGDVYGLGQGLAVEGEDDAASEEGDGEVEEESEEEEEDDYADLADVQESVQPGEDDQIDSEDEQALIATVARRQSKQTPKAGGKELPFTFVCPATHDELLDIIEANQITIEQTAVVLKRIRALHHPSLAEDNKFKLQAFLGVLLDHLVYISASLQNRDDKVRDTMQLIDSIVSQIFSLAKVYPLVAAEHFVNKLALMQRNLTRGLNKGPTELESKTWPGLTECVLLKVTSTIWPTSDRSHPVSTPLSILINQYLSGCRVRNLKDLTIGLFLCCLSYSNEQQSKRLLPESLNFLHNAIVLLAPVKSIKLLKQVNHSFGIPCPDIGLESSKQIQIDSQTSPADKVDFFAAMSTHSVDVEELKASLLQGSFQLLSDFAHLYTGSIAFVELSEPFHNLLENLSALHDTLEEKRKSTSDLLSRLLINVKSQRRFLRLQAHRAIAIASHVPKFDQGFNPERRGGRSFDPDSERAEQAKLRALLKKERKGAIRELRRDNDFLTNEKRKEREEEDSRYKKTMDKIVGSLSTERGEQKKYLQDKQRLKKRRGKK